MEKRTAIISATIIGLATLIGVASRFWFKKTDNFVEEKCEKVIENRTGINVDLSPDTPEETK